MTLWRATVVYRASGTKRVSVTHDFDRFEQLDAYMAPGPNALTVETVSVRIHPDRLREKRFFGAGDLEGLIALGA